MRVVLQRVKEAKVSVEGRVVGAIGTGYLASLFKDFPVAPVSTTRGGS